MAKQDEWARITLRLPPELHAKLLESAGAKSLNAEIVERLDNSFAMDAIFKEANGEDQVTVVGFTRLAKMIEEIRTILHAMGPSRSK